MSLRQQLLNAAKAADSVRIIPMDDGTFAGGVIVDREDRKNPAAWILTASVSGELRFGILRANPKDEREAWELLAGSTKTWATFLSDIFDRFGLRDHEHSVVSDIREGLMLIPDDTSTPEERDAARDKLAKAIAPIRDVLLSRIDPGALRILRFASNFWKEDLYDTLRSASPRGQALRRFGERHPSLVAQASQGSLLDELEKGEDPDVVAGLIIDRKAFGSKGIFKPSHAALLAGRPMFVKFDADIVQIGRAVLALDERRLPSTRAECQAFDEVMSLAEGTLDAFPSGEVRVLADLLPDDGRSWTETFERLCELSLSAIRRLEAKGIETGEEDSYWIDKIHSFTKNPGQLCEVFAHEILMPVLSEIDRNDRRRIKTAVHEDESPELEELGWSIRTINIGHHRPYERAPAELFLSGRTLEELISLSERWEEEADRRRKAGRTAYPGQIFFGTMFGTDDAESWAADDPRKVFEEWRPFLAPRWADVDFDTAISACGLAARRAAGPPLDQPSGTP